MTHADDMKGPVLRAAGLAGEVSAVLTGNDLTVEKVGASLNNAKASIEQAQRELIIAIKKQREALADARSVLMGTTGYVAESIEMLGRSGQEMEDNVVKLQRMKESIDTMLAQIVPAYKDGNSTAGARARNASAHLRGYASTL